MSVRASSGRVFGLLLVAVAVVSASSALARRDPPPKAEEQALQVALRGDTIVSPTLTASGGKRYLTVQKGVRIKLTVKSEDKTYLFTIVGKTGAGVTVNKNQTSPPVYFSCAQAGEEHEIKLSVGGKQVSSGLYLRAR